MTASLFDAPTTPPRPKTEGSRVVPYFFQTTAVEGMRQAWEEARDSGEAACRRLLIAAGGAGKTEMAMMLRDALPELAPHRYIFIVDMDALVWQTARRFRNAFPHLNIEVEKAGDYADLSKADVVIASTQTLGQQDPTHPKGFHRRLRRFPPMGIVVIDEAHSIRRGGMAARVLDYFGVGEEPDPTRRAHPRYPTFLLGCSATPARHDGQGLHYWFEDYIHNPHATDAENDTFDFRFLIEQGFLVEPVAHRIETGVDISHVRSGRGDFKKRELEQAVNVEHRNKLIVKSFMEMGGRSGLAFTAGVDMAHILAEMFNDAGVSAKAVDGSMKKRERKPIYDAFRAGELHVITNDSVLWIGADFPICDTIMSARPTKSHPRYAQEIYRGSRPYCNIHLPTKEERLAAIAGSSKSHFTILDFCDMAGNVPIVKAPCLFGLNKDFNTEGRRLITDVIERVEAVEEEHPSKRIRDAVSLEDVQVIAEKVDVWSVAEGSPELHAASDFRWMQLRDDVVQLEVPQETDRKGTPVKGGEDRHYLRAVQDALGTWRVDKLYPRRWTGKFLTKEKTVPGSKRFDTMEEAMKAADTHIKRNKKGLKKLMEREPAWAKGRMATAKQAQFMDTLGVYYPKKADGSPDVSMATASGLIQAARSMKNK